MSRKRAAPGADAVGPSNYRQAQTGNQWSNANMDGQGNYGDLSNFNVNSYQDTAPTLQTESSNQLTRRSPSQMGLAQYGGNNASGWPMQQYTAQQVDTVNDGNWQDDDDDLERRAEIAERAALSKRKSIPPFVQKLRSFVDDEKNADLIRWSDDGESFIVLDEDEFAKKLIPELFKHNKYPSFVRQLNMYGFHKRVALADNSMRASERKSKSPSEYHNPFFKRGRPRLMWLIQKPKSGPGKKGPNGEDIDDDDEIDLSGGPGRSRQSIVPAGGQRVLSQEAQQLLRDELRAITRNQAAIQEEVRKLREENEMMQSRAAAYQAIHQRHENSINAILTFLATVFRNQLEGRDTASLASLFPQAPSREQQGDRVVDLGNLDGRDSRVQSNTPRPQRRPLLLEAAPQGNSPSRDNQRSSSRISNVTTPTATEFPGRDGSTAPPTSQDAPTPDIKREEGADAGINDDIISFLNSQTSGPGGGINRLDYPQALSQLQSANQKSAMSTPQRNDLLRLMANGQAGSLLNGNGNNALTSPSPPPMPGPSAPEWEARKKEIEALERSIAEQDDRFNNVTQILGPISPSGSINFTDHEGHVPPPDFDLDWLNQDPNALGGLDTNDNPFFDFDLKDADVNNGASATGMANDDAHLSVDRGGAGGTATNSEAASPAATVNTVHTVEEPNEDEGGRGLDPPNKRQRVV